MPPIPAKSDLLRQLLTEKHTTELFLGASGKPVFALIVSAERLSEHEAEVYHRFLQLVAKIESGQPALEALAVIEESRPSPAAVALRPDLVVDLERYEVQRGRECLPLRAREAEVLRLLLHRPRRYIRAEALAEAIGSMSEAAPEHPVEEIVRSLRRKLGETPYHPRLIRCKRYAGYAIFPGETSAAPQNRPE
jgi:DNA-binding response OmpR family regulator